MGKDNSAFDFENDSEFSDNFYKNIEKALGNQSTSSQDTGLPEDTANEKLNEVQAPKLQEKYGNEEVQLREKSTDNSIRKTENSTVDSTADNTVDSTQVKEIKAITADKDLKDNINTGDKPTKEMYAASASEIEPASEEEGMIKIKLSEEADSEVVNEELNGINEALARQISKEMDTEATDIILAKKKKRLFKIQSGVLLTLLCIVGFGFFFGFTKPGNQLLMRMGVNISGSIWDSRTKSFGDSTDVTADIDYLDEEDLNSTAPELDPSTIVWPDHPGEGRQEDGVYNILILGEEAIGMGDARGRTDVIVIATMNTKNKSLKLTSLMRDMLVQIPGYKENKLNTAFEKGGLDLLYQTIALNLDLRLDGCVMVNFENFEKIINDLRGLEITLTDGEAKYLNSTNYISNPAYRNVKAGKQILNGNQVLGYSRVRKRSTITGNNNDYGRTDRHRIVLNAIFEKCKTENKANLASMMFKFLDMITTDIDSKCFQMLLNNFIDMGMNTGNIEQLRVPVDGAFEDNVKVRGMSVLIPDYEKNIEALHSFIFGDNTTGGASAGINAEAETKTTGTLSTAN